MPTKTFRAGDEVWIKSSGIKGTVTYVLPLNGFSYYKVEEEDGDWHWYTSSDLDKIVYTTTDNLTATGLELYCMRGRHRELPVYDVGDRVLIKKDGAIGTVTQAFSLVYGIKLYKVEKDDHTWTLYVSSDLDKPTATALEHYGMRKVHQGFSVSTALVDDMRNFINKNFNTEKENETMPTENMKEKMNQIRWVPMNVDVRREHWTPAADFTATLRGYVVTDCDRLSTLDISRDLENRLKLGHARADAAIKKVIFNDPATIVMWEDGTKTVVKCHNEKYDPEKGLAMAFMKKTMGNKGNYYEVVKKALKDYVPQQDE